MAYGEAMGPEDHDHPVGEGLVDRADEALRHLEAGVDRVVEEHQSMKATTEKALIDLDRLLRLHSEISGSLRFGAIAMWFLGGQLSWAVASAMSDDHVPAWPSFAAAGAAAVFGLLALVRARQERWERNLQTLQDNILVLLLTVVLGVVFLILGR